jgi:hypothetical protein
MAELLFDCVSKPAERYYHSWNGCGWHSSGGFDSKLGQRDYGTEMNTILGDYDTGYEMSERGEMLHRGEKWQRQLLTDPLPVLDPERVENKVEAARTQFRRYGASTEDRRNAVRLLADALELLRPKLKGVITSKDEGDLFNIANNFGVRHHNDRQQTDYDWDLWLDWMFYYYLNTVTMVIKKLAPPVVVEPAKQEEEVRPWWDQEVATTELEDLPF